MDIKIRKLDINDWKPVAEIYRQGIQTKKATFEKSVPPWIEWDKRHLAVCRFVAELDKKVIGWAALLPVSSRKVYKGVAETSIYVSQKFSGKGVGKLLLNAVIEESERRGIWSLQAVIFPENKSSISLYKSCGFREIGFREKIACLDGVWKNTVLFEKRSRKTGI